MSLKIHTGLIDCARNGGAAMLYTTTDHISCALRVSAIQTKKDTLRYQ